MINQTPKPDFIYGIRDKAYETSAMFAGMELDLFTPLDNGPMTVEQLAASLGVEEERLGPLLFALVSYGLLVEKGGKFSNTPVAGYHFVRGKGNFIGESVKIWKNNLLAALNSAESIRTNYPQAKYDWRNMDQKKLEELMEGMAAHDADCARRLSRDFDFSECRTLLDGGCGSGALAIAMTKIHPQMHATVVDLPEVTPITEKTIKKANAQDKVKVIPADLTKDPLPDTYDAAILSSIIQVLGPDEARNVILNVGKSVKPEGWLYVFGSGMLRDSRLSPMAAVKINLVFINVYDGGQSYTESEYRRWLAEAGYSTVNFDYDNLIISAQKDQ